jgi:CheY-like chemotaxis protein
MTSNSEPADHRPANYHKPAQTNREPAANSQPHSQSKVWFLQQLAELAKVILLFVLMGFLIWHWSFFLEWMRNIRHAELLGVKFDIVEANENIGKIFEKRTSEIYSKQDIEQARSAITQAARVAPAIQGARILWVDERPQNNVYERRVLQGMGISVQLALNTKEAIYLITNGRENPDLIVSDMGREDEKVPLSKCPGA